MTRKNLSIALLAFTLGFAVAFYKYPPKSSSYEAFPKGLPLRTPCNQQALGTFMTSASGDGTGNPNFTSVAEIATSAVVNVKATFVEKITPPADGKESQLEKLLKEFFDGSLHREFKSTPQPRSGSGVIISSDGYIVTNNHVVDEADCVEITLNDNRSYLAKVIGYDKATDLALLKIEEKNLANLSFGDSDSMLVGDWVLAVGNPFNLTSTVTKGIISAKSRNISAGNRSKNGLQIESFIQTDAPMNPGNSGGALVNMKGELIGINAALVAPYGAYVGYSFAIPSSIAKEVVNDLMLYGMVRRVVLGITGRDLDAAFAKEKKVKQLSGIYVTAVEKRGSAADAGIKEDDIIVGINGVSIKSTSQMHEQLLKCKPNDVIKLKIVRSNKEKIIEVNLKNTYSKVVVQRDGLADIGGAMLETVDADLKTRLHIHSGIHVKDVKAGPMKTAGVKRGFIIKKINNIEVPDVPALCQLLSNKNEVVLVSGVDSKGEEFHVAVDLRVQEKK